MLWLTRPPYLRWVAAVAIVVAALAWDLSKRQSEPYPFAAQPIAAGTAITEEAVDWRPVAADSMPEPLLVGATASVDIPAGDPLTRAVVTSTPTLPPGWWSVPVNLPFGVPVGASIRVILPDGSATTGIVTQPASSDDLGLRSPGSVGFPQSVADSVAQLAATGNLVVLVEP